MTMKHVPVVRKQKHELDKIRYLYLTIVFLCFPRTNKTWSYLCIIIVIFKFISCFQAKSILENNLKNAKLETENKNESPFFGLEIDTLDPLPGRHF